MLGRKLPPSIDRGPRVVHPRILGWALALVAFTASADTFVCSGDSIRVFADAADTGNPAPLRIITGSATVLAECYGLAIDAARQELWVANGGEAFVYALAADGDVAPLRGIPVRAAGLGFAVSVAVDAAADELFVGTADGRIHVFPRAVAKAPPLRSIDTTAAGVFTIVGLAVDRSRDEVLVAGIGNPATLAAFPRTANGVGVPVRAPLPLADPGGIAVDAGRDEWYVVSGTSVIVTRAGQTLATFSAGTLVSPYGLAIRADRQVLVGDRWTADPDRMLRFPPHPNGNAGPLATIFNASATGRTAWGVATSMEAPCAAGNTVSCAFQDGFE